MSFRPANESDLETLLELRRDFCEHEQIQSSDASSLESMRQLATDASLGRLLVIEHDGAIAGCASRKKCASKRGSKPSTSKSTARTKARERSISTTVSSITGTI